MKRAMLAVGLALVAVAAVAGPASAAPPVNPAPPGAPAVLATTNFNAGAFQFGASDGAVATVDVAAPFVGAGAIHSATFLAVQSADTLQTIEVGYHVRPGLYGNSRAHLFIAHWVNGVFQCFNSACGLVQQHAVVRPGMEVGSGVESQFMIQHVQGGWRIGMLSEWVGFLPDSRWGGSFTRAGLVQWLGEVQTDGSSPCADMGNSMPPESSLAATFREISYFNGPTLSLRVTETNHALYRAALISASTVAYGGRGVC